MRIKGNKQKGKIWWKKDKTEKKVTKKTELGLKPWLPPAPRPLDNASPGLWTTEN